MTSKLLSTELELKYFVVFTTDKWIMCCTSVFPTSIVLCLHSCCCHCVVICCHVLTLCCCCAVLHCFVTYWYVATNCMRWVVTVRCNAVCQLGFSRLVLICIISHSLFMWTLTQSCRYVTAVILQRQISVIFCILKRFGSGCVFQHLQIYAPADCCCPGTPVYWLRSVW